MQKWEYRVLVLRPRIDSSSEEEMNQLGEVGWELTATVSPYNSSIHFLYFKRPKV